MKLWPYIVKAWREGWHSEAKSEPRPVPPGSWLNRRRRWIIAGGVIFFVLFLGLALAGAIAELADTHEGPPSRDETPTQRGQLPEGIRR